MEKAAAALAFPPEHVAKARIMARIMADTKREVWITGVGIVSCLGEGPQAHWQGLNAAPGPADTTTWAPFVIHPIAALDLDKQIPKKGDQRQMEAWQRIGTYAAGSRSTAPASRAMPNCWRAWT